MKNLKMRLNSIQDVKEFIEAVSFCDYDVDVSRDKYMIDGKSVLGLLSFDLSKPLDVTLHTDSEKDIDSIMEKISKFVV